MPSLIINELGSLQMLILSIPIFNGTVVFQKVTSLSLFGIRDVQSKLKYHIKELINALVGKKFSNLENYFDFY